VWKNDGKKEFSKKDHVMIAFNNATQLSYFFTTAMIQQLKTYIFIVKNNYENSNYKKN
jgi:hypothetical protein